MMYNLVDKFDPILKQKLEPFDFDAPPMDPNELSSKLMETCMANKGVAISANQVGLPYRVFIINMKGEIMPIFNPIIISTDLGEDVYYEEGCLTYPGLFLKIKRPSAIRVRVTDNNGLTDTHKFSGLTARIILHEYDHMEGVNFLSRATIFHRENAFRKAKRINRKLNQKTA